MPDYFGLIQIGIESIAEAIKSASRANCEAIAVPVSITNLPYDFDSENLAKCASDILHGDMIIPPEAWNSKIITMLSDDLDCDSEDPKIRRDSERQLKSELSWCEYVQSNGYSMVSLKSAKIHNLARVISSNIKIGSILVRVPANNPQLQSSVWRNDLTLEDCVNLDGDDEERDTWHWWNNFRWAADFHNKLKVVLELTETEMPSVEVIRRWVGEPLEAVIIPATMFMFNKHNYPVIPKVWQQVLQYFIAANANIYVTAGLGDNNIKQYFEFLAAFRDSNRDSHELSIHQDVLQTPLQPLYDNLDSYTYDTFEKDPSKYKLYQIAIEHALMDRVTNEEKKSKLTVIMVLGAGRGPLVRAALNASDKTERKVRIYIIDKNPNAIRSLNAIKNTLWKKYDVQIFSKDMRKFTPPEKADILVSELLGSFGDNELSPECLDCASDILKPDGISIPCKSTSFINPVMSQRLYNSVRNVGRYENSFRAPQSTYFSNSEYWFVALLKSIYHIDEPQALFDFVHPDPEANPDHSRFKTLRFQVPADCVINGIAGYFEAVLYKGLKISIHPLEHTPGMFSWFPVFFPLATPFNLKMGQTVEIQFWRCTTPQKVWYEWSLTAPVKTHIHNHGGRNAKCFTI